MEHVPSAVASEVPRTSRTFGEEWTVIEGVMSLQGPGSVYCHWVLTLCLLRVSEGFMLPGTSWWPVGADGPQGGQ